MKKNNVKFGLLGYGAWGQRHASIINKTAGAELVAVSDAQEERREKARSDFPITAYSDYEDLIGLEDVDLIDVTLPNYLHLEAAVKAIEAGKHLLLEKPMGLTEQECDGILRARCQARRKKNEERLKSETPILAIGFELRVSSLWRKVKELIDEDTIGRPRSAQMEVFRSLPHLGRGAWRLDRNKAGSWMLDGPIHYFDLLRWYFSSAGETRSVYSAASSRKTDSFDSSFSSVLSFASGAFAALYYCMGGFGHTVALSISGDKGGIKASWEAMEGTSIDPAYRLRVGRGASMSDIGIDGKPGEIFDLENEIRELVKSVREGNAPDLAGAPDGKESVRICLAAEKSLDTGERVDV